MKLLTHPKQGDTIDASDSMYPTVMRVAEHDHLQDDSRTTSYGYVLSGTVVIEFDEHRFKLREGAYFSVPGCFRLQSVDEMSRVVLIERFGYRGLLNVGRIEERGRLSYIDGCSDTLIVSPPRLGDPCFNFLHFPAGVDQTQHTHPSIRMGIVASGRGTSYANANPKCKFAEGWERELTPGCIFMLEEQELHSFRTTDFNSHMNIIAYHPDSDFGPTDEDHPMKNRTYAPQFGTMLQQ